VFYLMVAKPQ